MLLLTRQRDGNVSYELSLKSQNDDDLRDRRTLSAPVPIRNKRPAVARIPFEVWALRYEKEIELATNHFEAMVRSVTRRQQPEVLPGAMERMRESFVERLYVTSANARRDYFV